jgi:hypothetical protein
MAYVRNLEEQGIEVHYPDRDTKQIDSMGGYNIVTDNREALLESDEIHIWFDEKSTGSVFDLGMAWLGYKPLVIANEEEVKRTDYKSFNNVILDWATLGPDYRQKGEDVQKVKDKR